MFERFTDRARRVVVLAQEEARMLRHNYIGSAHLLLGLLEEDGGVGLQILQELGADHRRIRQQAADLMTSDPEGAGAQQVFREEISLSVHGEAAAEPRCPRCMEELGDRLRARTMNATDDTDEERTHRALVVWCGNCGTVLGIHPGAAE